MVEARGGTPATASLHRLNQACYRLHKVTRELKEGKGKDERGLATLTMAALSSGEAPHMAAVAEMTNAASP
jgi:geranylgeranyl pyrophosphate synthase